MSKKGQRKIDELARKAMEAVNETAQELLDNTDVTVVQGFEIPVTLASELTDDAVFILGYLKRYGVAVFEIDDSSEDAKTHDQLKAIAEREGYFDMFDDDEHKIVLVDNSKKFRVKLAH